jgi:hypothetical protein
MKLFILFIVGVTLAGCKPHAKRTADQFKFLELWMSVNDITNRVGQPDRGYRGQYRLRYDLADGTEMVIAAHEVREYAPDTLRVYWFGQSRDGNWLWLKQTTGDLSHYLQWTQATPVTIYMFGGMTASGTLVSVSNDAIQVRDSGTNTASYDKDLILWIERNTQ